jgi:hypothetical protein
MHLTRVLSRCLPHARCSIPGLAAHKALRCVKTAGIMG